MGCMSAKVILAEEKLGLMEQSEKCGMLGAPESHAHCRLASSRKML